MLALCLALAAVAGCGKGGGGGGGSQPTVITEEQAANVVVDTSAVSDILEVEELRPMGPMLEVSCSVSRRATIVVEYPAAEGTRTTEVDVAPPAAVITAVGFKAGTGQTIVIKPAM